MINWLKNKFSRFKENDLGWNQADKLTFAKSVKRKASSAKIGGFRPTNTFAKSRVAGDFVMLDNEPWPMIDGLYLDPILQLNVTELPFIPNKIKNVKLITIFINLKSYEQTREFKNNYEIRTYDSFDGIQLKKFPSNNDLKSFEIEWEEKIDTPSLEELIWLEGNPERGLPMSDIFYEMKLEEHWNTQTKVGGWPFTIQHELDMATENFIFQIGSEEKAKLAWTDSGIIYFGLQNGEWKIEHQFY